MKHQRDYIRDYVCNNCGTLTRQLLNDLCPTCAKARDIARHHRTERNDKAALRRIENER